MKILITGAAGGIGSLLSQYLCKNHELILVDNFRNGFKENLPNFKVYNLDICSKEFVEFTIKNTPDLIIHLAAITSLPDCEINKNECIEINVNGTVNVMEACREANVSKIIFASTSAIYEDNNIEDIPFKENLSVFPKLFYSMSKKMAEDICNAYINNYGLNIIILRFFNVFGPNQDFKRKSPPLLNYLVQSYFKNESPVLHSDGKQSRDYISVYDLIDLIQKIICNNDFESDIYNVSSGSTMSVSQIADLVKKYFNSEIEPIYRSASNLWDAYPQLFETYFPISKKIIEKETNKYSLGCNKKLLLKYGWEPNINFKEEFFKVIDEMAQRLKN